MKSFPSEEKILAAIATARKNVAAFARHVAPMYAALKWEWGNGFSTEPPCVPDRKRIRKLLYEQLDELPAIVQQVGRAIKSGQTDLRPGMPCGPSSGGLSTLLHAEDGEAVVSFEFTAARAECNSSGKSAIWW